MEFGRLTNDRLEQFKADMKAAFRFGAAEGLGVDEEVLPEEDILRSLNAEGAAAYMACDHGELVGGAIVVIHPDSRINHLDFLYVKVGRQGQKIGQFLWCEIQKAYPQTLVWETCTPYFDQRNIHFYINCCGFHAVEFFNRHHPDPAFPEETEEDMPGGMFRFQKRME